MQGHVLKMNFVNANPALLIYGEGLLSHYSNYFLGQDSCNWRGHVPHYQKVVIENVWPGINVELVAQKEGVETVYHVAPYADPSQIQIQYEGLDAPLSVDAACPERSERGSLLLQTSLGIVKEQAPWAYQKEGRVQKTVDTHYHVMSASAYALSVSVYDSQKELVIDPLLYGSYLGGDGPDHVKSIKVTASGEFIVGGQTQAGDFPTTPGAYMEHRSSGMGGFVSRINSSGDSLRFSTLFGAEQFGLVRIRIVDLDSLENVYAIGDAETDDVPLTPDALDSSFEGNREGFIARFSPDGTELQYSSYLGGPNPEILRDASVGPDGKLYICGEAGMGFPVTPNALFPNAYTLFGEAFLAIYDPLSNELAYSSFLNGTHLDDAWDLEVISSRYVWLCGTTMSIDFPTTTNALQSENGGAEGTYDGFLTLWDLEANLLAYSSYLGGDTSDAVDSVWPLSISEVWLAGGTRSTDFPVSTTAFDTIPPVSNSYDGFIARISTEQGLVAATYIGGDAGTDYALSIRGFDGTVVVAGGTLSNDFPVTTGAYDTVYNSNGNPDLVLYDVFVARFNLSLSILQYSTFLEGSHLERPEDAWIENPDTIWVVGETGSTDLPVTPAAFQDTGGPLGDGFILRLSISDTMTNWPSPEHGLPTTFAMSVYPNPFNPTATLSFTLPQREFTSLRLYDLLGRIVREQNLGWKEAGEYRITLDAQSLPSGTYITQLQAGHERLNRTLILLR